MALRDWRPNTIIGLSSDNFNIHEFVVPDQERWHIMSIWITYTTSDTAANRQIAMHVYDSSGGAATDELFRTRPGLVQAASLTYNYALFPGAADITTIRDSDFCSTPIPATLVLSPGYSVVLEEQSSADTSSDSMTVKMLYQMSRVPSTS